MFRYLGEVEKQELSHDKKWVNVYVASPNGTLVLRMSKEDAVDFIPGKEVRAEIKS